MVQTCMYCASKWIPGNRRTFHAFPLKNPEKLEKWLKNLNIPANKVTSTTRLCSDHFEDKYFKLKGLSSKLLPWAVPTLLVNRKSTCVYCKVKRSDNRRRLFHKFPLEKEDLLKKWLNSIPTQMYKLTDASLLCSDHFEPDCYDRKRKLNANAVPTIFEPIPQESSANECNVPPAEQFETRQEAENEEMGEQFQNEKMEFDIESIRNVYYLDSSVSSTNTLNTTNPDRSFMPNVTLQPYTPRMTTSMRKRYFGDRNHETNSRMLTILKKTKQQLAEVRQENKILKQKVKQKDETITSLKKTVSELECSKQVSEAALSALDFIAKSDVSEIVAKFLKD